MKSWTVFFVISVVVTFTLLENLVSSQSTSFYVDPPSVINYSLISGEKFTVDVNLTDVTDAYAWQSRIVFDPNILSVVDVTRGSFFTDCMFLPPTINNTNGWVLAGCSKVGPGSVSGNGTIANIIFQVIGNGESYINFDLSKTVVVKPDLTEIPSEKNNGYFKNSDVTTEPPPPDTEPPVWSNLRHCENGICNSPQSVTVANPIDLKVDWSDNVELQTVIISENSTGWVNHTCNLVTGECSGELFFVASSSLIIVFIFVGSLTVMYATRKVIMKRSVSKFMLPFLVVILCIIFISIFLFPEISRNVYRILTRLVISPFAAPKTFTHTIPAENLSSGQVVTYKSYARDTTGNEAESETKTFSVEIFTPPVRPTSFHVDPPSVINYSLTPGENFTVDVNLTDVTDAYAWQSRIVFDPNVLTVLEVIEWCSYIYPVIDNTNGNILIGCAESGDEPDIDDGTLAIIKFQVKENGESGINFDLSRTSLLGTNFEFISSEKNSGYFNNDPNIIPSTTSDPITSSAQETYEPNIEELSFDTNRIVEVGQTPNITSRVMDIVFVNSTWMNVTKPDGGRYSVIPTKLEEDVYSFIVAETDVVGRYNFSISAINPANNLATEYDHFYVGESCNINLNFTDGDDNEIDVIYNFSLRDEKERLESGENDIIDKTMPGHEYNLSLKKDNITLDLMVNITEDISGIIIIDSLNASTLSGVSIPDSVVKLGYGINASIRFDQGSVIINYTNVQINENKIKVYKCDDWNVTERSCSSSWYETDFSIDMDSDLIEISASSFSGFILVEYTPPTPPPPADDSTSSSSSSDTPSYGGSVITTTTSTSTSTTTIATTTTTPTTTTYISSSTLPVTTTTQGTPTYLIILIVIVAVAISLVYFFVYKKGNFRISLSDLTS